MVGKFQFGTITMTVHRFGMDTMPLEKGDIYGINDITTTGSSPTTYFLWYTHGVH
jgi:hypothetical protein